MTGDKPYNQTFQVTLVQSLGRKDPLEEDSLKLCIQMFISFLFSFAFHFSSFHSYL